MSLSRTGAFLAEHVGEEALVGGFQVHQEGHVHLKEPQPYLVGEAEEGEPTEVGHEHERDERTQGRFAVSRHQPF